MGNVIPVRLLVSYTKMLKDISDSLLFDVLDM